ncbi:MAG: bifunctional riboflavin kinase/FAD synthetase [Pseudomonadota bacterium]
MQIFESYKNIPETEQGSVVVIGNFDGVHLGHQALLRAAQEIAKPDGLKVSVLTFEPHPRWLFRPDDPPFRLTPKSLKADRLEEAGVDALFSVGFDWDFASQSADQFIQDVLLNGLAPAHVVVGYDFRFGQMRKGGPGDIEAAGLKLTVVAEVADEDKSEISSSEARKALRYGKIDQANAILGWEWEIRGEVVKGDQRGRELGYPTANFALGDVVHPAYGIYACRVQIEGEEEWRNAAVNIGIRPMFEIPQAQVESFILDYEGDLYGKILRVKPVQFLRGEAKFNSVDELVAQMEKDCMQAREILS